MAEIAFINASGPEVLRGAEAQLSIDASNTAEELRQQRGEHLSEAEQAAIQRRLRFETAMLRLGEMIDASRACRLLPCSRSGCSGPRFNPADGTAYCGRKAPPIQQLTEAEVLGWAGLGED